eukprot:Colp12_sorted_trinity150504_noHs@16254
MIKKEQEKNESLTMLLNKVESEVTFLKRQIDQCGEKREKLKETFTTYTRTLRQTEDELNLVLAERAALQNELNQTVRQTETAVKDRKRIEEEIVQRISAQLTLVRVCSLLVCAFATHIHIH